MDLEKMNLVMSHTQGLYIENGKEVVIYFCKNIFKVKDFW